MSLWSDLKNKAKDFLNLQCPKCGFDVGFGLLLSGKSGTFETGKVNYSGEYTVMRAYPGGRRVPYIVKDSTHHYQCPKCQHQWTSTVQGVPVRPGSNGKSRWEV